MLPPKAVASLIAGLAEYAGGDRAALPAPEFQVISEYVPTNGPKCFEFNLIHETVWRGWDPDRHLPDLVGLAEFTDLLTSTARRWLPQGREPRFTIVGFTLMYDDRAGTAEPGRGAAGAATRVTAAVDLDGRSYVVPNTAGRPGTVQVTEPGTPPALDTTDPLAGNLRVALSALTCLVDIATDELPHDTGDEPVGHNGDPLVAGEIVTVQGDRWDDDQRAQLWVVVDNFHDYTIAVLGGDGYQWPRVPRNDLTPVTPEWIRKVRRDHAYAYAAHDTTAPVLIDETFTGRGADGYQLHRLYQVAGLVLRVHVLRAPQPDHSRAEAHLLNAPGDRTVVAATAWTYWYTATPAEAATGEPLHPVAEQLLQRATRILTAPADPTDPASASGAGGSP